MTIAKNAGIDAFALNFGVDDWVPEQLQYAYDSAAQNGISVFPSVDFNWYSPGSAGDVGDLLSRWITQPAQLKIGGRAFVSTFAGDGLDLDIVRQRVRDNKAGEMLVVPNFHGSLGGADGLFNWMAWPSNGANRAPTASNNVSVADGDNTYLSILRPDKPYMARKWYHWEDEVIR